jgi:hypothetical protein
MQSLVLTSTTTVPLIGTAVRLSHPVPAMISLQCAGHRSRSCSAIGNFGGQNELFVQSSHGTFNAVPGTPISTFSRATQVLIWADLDGNGFVDLVVGNSGRSEINGPPFDPNELYFNRGNLSFEVVTHTLLTTSPRQVFDMIAGDIDGDGWLDVIEGSWGVGQEAGDWERWSVRIFRNMGAGDFDLVRPPHEARTGVRSMALGDYDGDGDLDLALATCYNDDSRLFRNDGTGAFVFVHDQARYYQRDVLATVWVEYRHRASNLGLSHSLLRDLGSSHCGNSYDGDGDLVRPRVMRHPNSSADPLLLQSALSRPLDPHECHRICTFLTLTTELRCLHAIKEAGGSAALHFLPAQRLGLVTLSLGTSTMTETPIYWS